MSLPLSLISINLRKEENTFVEVRISVLDLVPALWSRCRPGYRYCPFIKA